MALEQHNWGKHGVKPKEKPKKIRKRKQQKEYKTISLKRALDYPQPEKPPKPEKTRYQILQGYASEKRSNPTPAEAVLLKMGIESEGFWFQAVVAPRYIPDFLHPLYKIIIEVDGEYHDDPEQKNLDMRRTNWLKDRGYKVLRFKNRQVETSPNTVMKAILDFKCEVSKR